MTHIATVVPFRLGGLTRLAGVLTDRERERLGLAMLVDVVAALRAAGSEPVVAAADAPTRDAVLGELTVACTVDPPDAGLDGSIARYARDHPDGLLVVMADLPTLTADDVEALLARPDRVVIAVTDDGGTGALLRRPADIIATSYGQGSAARHARLASQAQVDHAVVDVPGLGFEIDTPDDLHAARSARLGTATTALLASLDA